MASGSVRVVLPVALASRSTSALSLCGERWADEPRMRSAADDHARRAGVRSAKVKLVRGVQHRGEAERPREGFRADQVWFLEFQPGQIADLDQGVAGAPGVLPAQGALLAVQVFVGVDMWCHGVSSID